ncbi:hypothetical protein D3C85_1810180 [compost metagenome]
MVDFYQIFFHRRDHDAVLLRVGLDPDPDLDHHLDVGLRLVLVRRLDPDVVRLVLDHLGD